MQKGIIVLLITILIYIGIFPVIACWILPIGSFRSSEEKSFTVQLPTDAEPGINGSYRPTVSFSGGQFREMQSDFFISGSYECRLARVVTHSSIGASASVGYIPFFGLLQWKGEWYQNIEQLSLLLVVGAVIAIREIFRRWL